MSILLIKLLEFIGFQILKALLTAQAVKDAVLFALKELATHTKNTWDDQVYSRVKFYFNDDKSEHLIKDDFSDLDKPKDPENK
jgi:hypothetical protein